MFSLVWSYRLSRAVLVCWGSRLHQLPRAHSGLVWGVERGSPGPAPASSPSQGSVTSVGAPPAPAPLTAPLVGVTLHGITRFTSCLPAQQFPSPSFPGNSQLCQASLSINIDLCCIIAMWLFLLFHSAVTFLSEWSRFLAGKRHWITVCFEKHHTGGQVFCSV